MSDRALADFFEDYPTSRRLFQALRPVAEAPGGVEIRITQSQIAFVRDGHPFAWAWIPARWLRGRNAPLVVTVSLARRDASPRWKEVVEPVPGRFTHHLELRHARDVDDEVQGWLREAALGTAAS